MNVKRLERRLKKEYIADGYVRIDRVATDYDADGSVMTIEGAYGYQADGKYIQHDFELFFDGADRNNYEYLAGMFAQIINNQDNE